MPNFLEFQIILTPVNINYFARQNIFHYRIDGKISTFGGFLKRHVWIAFDNETFMSPRNFSLSARQRNIQILPDFIDRKRFANRINSAELLEDFFQFARLNSINLNVKIFRLRLINSSRTHPPTSIARPLFCLIISASVLIFDGNPFICFEDFMNK